MDEKRELSLLEKMKKAIEELEKRNDHLTDVIGELTSKPLGYATVLRVGNETPMPRPAKAEDFKRGVKVRVKEQFMDEYTMRFPTGKVLKAENGKALVQFVDGTREAVYLTHMVLQDPVYEVQKTITVSFGGEIMELLHPENSVEELLEGDTVMVNGFRAIVAKAPTTQMGSTAVVKEVLENRYCEILEGDRTRTVFTGRTEGIEKGDHVTLDTTGSIVLKNTKQDTTDFTVQTSINVSWDQIGGLKHVEEQVREMIELPHKFPDVFRFYNKKPAKGVLFYGPPGCGKTLIAKAVGTTLAKIHKGNLTESGFIYVKGPEILNQYVGNSEQTIRNLFERAKKYKAKMGHPATMFIDEADSILSKRGTGVSSDMEKTIVPMFLAEMDGLEDSAAFIILATNRADTLDPAVTREGRIDLSIQIPRPSRSASKAIAVINFNNTKVAESIEDISEFLVEKIFTSSLQNRVSGAMIAGIVEQSITQAIRRDLQSKQKPKGIVFQDVEKALESFAEREFDIKSANKALQHV